MDRSWSHYTLYLSRVIDTDSFSGISDHLYDTQIYTSLTPENSTTALMTLQQCTVAVQSWVTQNQLKLNIDKTEYLLIGQIGTPTKRASLAMFYPY